MFKPRQMVKVVKIEPNWPEHTSEPPKVGMTGMVVKSHCGDVINPPDGRIPVRLSKVKLGFIPHDGWERFVVYNLRLEDITPM